MNLDDDLDDDLVDGCGVDMEAGPLEDGTDDLYVLFAEALDPSSDVTVKDVERQWGKR
jgi:hypothetical protein